MKLPISTEQQVWVDGSFKRLASLVGANRMLRCQVVEPTPGHFPDRYDQSEEALRNMFQRVAERMEVDPGEIEMTLFASADRLTRELVPFHSGRTGAAAGLYYHDPADKSHISINESQLKDPMALVATLAHEIGHIVLLRPGLINRDDPYMEPLNDLFTVFVGFGIFTANSAFRFEQYSSNTSQGWSARRLGYLSEQTYGYSLARFAFERQEYKPKWASFLVTNIASYFKCSMNWLCDRQEPRLFVSD